MKASWKFVNSFVCGLACLKCTKRKKKKKKLFISVHATNCKEHLSNYISTSISLYVHLASWGNSSSGELNLVIRNDNRSLLYIRPKGTFVLIHITFHLEFIFRLFIPLQKLPFYSLPTQQTSPLNYQKRCSKKC